MLKSMTPILMIIKSLALIGCVLSLVLSAHFAIKKEKEDTQKFITISTILAIIVALSKIILKA